MSVKPIIFSGPMVRALLAGTKTQTRRLIKPQPEQNSAGLWCWPPPDEYPVLVSCKRYGGFCQADGEGLQYFLTSDARRLPYAPGDILYVREAWRAWSRYDTWLPRDIPADADMQHLADDPASPWDSRYRHARFMPRWASRLTLEVSEVRVQRLQDISEEDARAEGTTAPPDGHYGDGYCDDYRSSFCDLWNSLHGPDAWSENPWVAAYTFSVHHCNVDDLVRQREAA